MQREKGMPDSTFRFGNGRLCFTFTATLGNRGSAAPIERLARPADLARWCVELGLLAEPPATGAATLAEARRLREAIDQTAESVRTGTCLDPQPTKVINSWAARPALTPQLDETGSLRWRQEGAQTRHVLALVARDAVDLLTNPTSSRLRRCANPECQGMFVDVSAPGNRRWCSMNTCGNQAKKAAFRQRRTQLERHGP
ncbi:CGNR zinc finger domain-containing protein [Nonomuraea roseola]|uniref:CGNR zinc finger domain-containing protein n=2 Tax=Nonomuraea roseola TaxID=46179 RepID=A0ABV5Q8X2_9ACTN